MYLSRNRMLQVGNGFIQALANGRTFQQFYSEIRKNSYFINKSSASVQILNRKSVMFVWRVGEGFD